MSEPSLKEQAARMREVREMRDDAKREYEDLKAEYKELEASLFTRIRDKEKLDNFKSDGVRFTPTSTVYASINDRSEFIRWAEDNDPELIEPKERKELINQLARQCIQDGKPLPPGMTYYERNYISQSASK